MIDHSALSTLTISLQDVKDNIETLRSKVGANTRFMAIVKASAYGTDIVTMTQALSGMGIDSFGVANIEEGITLRRNGIDHDIFVIHAPPFQLHSIPDWNLTIALSDAPSIHLMESIAHSKRKHVKVHLHVNTGMNRFGCRPEEALALAKTIASSKWLQLEGIMSHFHSADIPEKDADTRRQIDLFDKVIESIEACGISIPYKHMANSSAACRFHLPQYNMVRIGIAMFGIHLSQHCEEALPLKMALTLKARVLDVNTCHKGETVSYEAKYTISQEKERIGVIGIGYHDGLHRKYGNSGHCCIKGALAPYIGNICMDFALINLSDLKEVEIGDSVTIFGHDPSGYLLDPKNVGGERGTCSHELLACLGPRIKREFLPVKG